MWDHLSPGLVALFFASFVTVAACHPASAQEPAEPPDKVLTLMWNKTEDRMLPQDRGAAGLWQKLQKLQTTASVLHTVAHPDDEHGGTLAYLSRGQGARVGLLTLNRGEGGANAVGSELFDALGLVRTEELLNAGAYYGLEDLYFTTMIDYGFSKNIEEAYRNWGKENVLRDVVRVIRIHRPLIVVARFHGSERDGHGHHQTAGVITQDAVRVSGDPTVFPEQITEEGLRPWTPLKTYRGGVREGEPWHVRLDVAEYSPWLGTSYRNFASEGLAYQRSQLNGIFREVTGPQIRYYERTATTVDAPERESGFFDGIDTSLPGLFTMLGEDAPAGAAGILNQVQGHVGEAVAAFSMQNPSAVVPHLVEGLRKTRQVLDVLPETSEGAFHLRIKERQFMDAINTALGLRFTATGMPAGVKTGENWWEPLPTMGAVVPGQQFQVEALLLNPSSTTIEPVGIDLVSHAGLESTRPLHDFASLKSNEKAVVTFDVTVPTDAQLSDRYYGRESIRQSRYDLRDPEYLHLPHRSPALVAVAQYRVNGVPVEIRETVRTREANFPYGYEMRELKVAPAIAVNVEPEMRVVPQGSGSRTFDLEIELLNNVNGPVQGDLTLEVPSNWTVDPPSQPFSFTQAGQRNNYVLHVTVPPLENRDYEVRAVATADGERFTQGYTVIRQRDNDLNYLYRDAVTQVRGIDVETVAGLNVGYVMGVGDDVPSGIEQLGADVTLLAESDLASADLSKYDAIVVGTRAYAVRPDLLTYNQRLLDYAENGGNLVVLYQTQEFVPGQMAPYPAALPPGAEEVSEEDAPVTILAQDHPVFNRPNKITTADFDGWVEQRGSKFFSTWNDAYVPMIETNDHGQEPQRGGWLTARVGDGYYTYFAYAMHRQTPYGVPGAYRILANLLALGRDNL